MRRTAAVNPPANLCVGFPISPGPSGIARTTMTIFSKSIREGKGMMPAKKDKLSPKELVLLVNLIRDFQGGKQVLPAEPEGQEETSRRTEPQTSAKPAEPGAGATRPASRSTSESKVPRPRRFAASSSGPAPHATVRMGVVTPFASSSHGSRTSPRPTFKKGESTPN